MPASSDFALGKRKKFAGGGVWQIGWVANDLDPLQNKVLLN
jgi:hypothetical protein